jgi:hypothetical protein
MATGAQQWRSGFLVTELNDKRTRRTVQVKRVSQDGILLRQTVGVRPQKCWEINETGKVQERSRPMAHEASKQ